MAVLPDIASALSTCELFSELPPEHRKTIAALCHSMSVPKNEHLFLEGRPGATMYVLASGSVQLVKTSPEGREVVIRTVRPGEVFAELMLFERDTYPVTAIALRRSTVYRLHRQDFRALLLREQFRDSFMAHIARRLRYLADRIVHLTTCDVEDRFFRFLRAQYGEKREYILGMSKKDIAAAIGTTPETLSRLVARLQKERKIAWKGKALRILRC